MQILIIKLRYILCITLFFTASSGLAATSFDEYFQISAEIDMAIADKVTHYYSEDSQLTDAQQKSELLKLEMELKSIEAENSDRSIYWFIKGLNDRNIATYYAEIDRPIISSQYIKNKNTAYKKALELSKDPSQQLSAAIYNTMKHGLPEDLKIEATQAELNQGGNIDNESAYWYLHWSNIDQLEKAGRHQEAEEAFKNMQKEMQDSGADISIYSELNQKIEKQTFNQSAITETTTEQAKAKDVEESRINVKDVMIPALIFISLSLLFLVTVYELVFKKRKPK